MHRLRGLSMVIVAAAMAACSATGPAGTDAAVSQASPLMFEPQTLDLGETVEGSQVRGELVLRNTGSVPLSLTGVQASCGCTTGQLDAHLLPPGGFTMLHIKIDTFAKRGRVEKGIWVTDDAGHTAAARLVLTVRPNPHRHIAGRSIFDMPCATCHAAPARGKDTGAAIYAAVCAMCHGADAKGGYAPSLRGRQGAAALARRIGEGTGHPSMPAFAKRRGGPLDAEQLRVLSRWLVSLR